MAKLGTNEQPLKWICFGCKTGSKEKVPCILTVHAAGKPIGCIWPGDNWRHVKWERCK